MSAPRDPRIVAGLRAQADERERELRAGARRLGWKAGFGTAAAKAALGLHAPLVGFLTDRTLLEGGAACGIADWTKPILEPEVAVRLGTDLEPGADRAAALAALDGYATAIELVDLGPADDVERILAGNIFHRHVLLGSFAPLTFGAALGDVRLDLRDRAGVRTQNADPAQALGDLVDVVRHVADQLPLAGTRLQAGDVVITGSAVPGVPVVPGERFEVRAGGLDPVSVVLT